MKKRFNYKMVVKVAVLILFTAFAGIQFMPADRNESKTLLETDFTKSFAVPDDVQNVLKTSCYDCHSNNTNYPWYNRIQPAAWFMEGHIADGKRELNFSEFGEYSKRRQKTKLKSIVSQIKSEEMPLPSYTYLHWGAKLSDTQKKRLEDWINGLQNEF